MYITAGTYRGVFIARAPVQSKSLWLGASLPASAATFREPTEHLEQRVLPTEDVYRSENQPQRQRLYRCSSAS